MSMRSAPARAVIVAIIALAAMTNGGSAQQPARGFDGYFSDKTMRVDYFHSGGVGQEIVALDRVVSDGPWPGSRTRLVDDTNLGKYLFEVIDRESNLVIYSRGFASIYGEWETTAEYKARHRTFPESLRFPWPKQPVQVVLKKRDAFYKAFRGFDPDKVARFATRDKERLMANEGIIRNARKIDATLKAYALSDANGLADAKAALG